MRLAGHVVNLHPFYMGEERRQATAEDFRRLLENQAFEERRRAIGGGNGGGNRSFLAVMFVGGIVLTQAVNFVNSRVLDSAFSREPPFTASWKESIDAKVLRMELALQGHESKLNMQDGRLEAQADRLQEISRKLDALLIRAEIDPNTLRNR